MSAAAAATHALTWRVATMRAGSVEWATPLAIYRALDTEFKFTLDVCASPLNAKHVRYLTKDVDALGISWARERVFCNPPYGLKIEAFVRKALLEATEHDTLAVMLLPARTDTIWFHDVVLPHAEIRFIRGRLSYTLGKGAGPGRAPFASMVAIFRPGSLRAGNGKQQLLFPFLPKRP